jgi:hypothetical protein
MKIQFILFHRQVRHLGEAAAGKGGLEILEKRITGQLMHLHFPPDAAFLAAGLIFAAREPYLDHEFTENSLDKISKWAGCALGLLKNRSAGEAACAAKSLLPVF